MNSRWGCAVEPKNNLHSAGQNNINININFNALKEKSKIFANKKIDNFLEFNNHPKSHLASPNISAQTTKFKRKQLNGKQYCTEQGQIKQKRSRSKLSQNLLTPQKNCKQKQSINSRSRSRKSPKKGNQKSFDNLKKVYHRSSPKWLQKQEQKQSMLSCSKSNSRSKSKSKSISNNKLTKNNKDKILLNSNKFKPNNSSNKQKQQPLINTQRINKIPLNKTQKLNKQQQSETIILRKSSAQRRAFKKSSKSDQQQNTHQTKPPSKKPSKQKQFKCPKRFPLHCEEEEPFSESNSTRKIHKQTLSNGQFTKKIKIKQSKHKKRKPSPYQKFLQQTEDANDLSHLNKAATTIQKIWKGFQLRKAFFNQLNLLYHKNSIARNRISNSDPIFWDDSQSNSILQADNDAESFSSQGFSLLHSDIQQPISQNSEMIINNHTIEYDQHQMIQRIYKLQEYLKKQQYKAQKLEKQNYQLKYNLQKVTIENQSGSTSARNPVNNFLKQESQQIKEKYENNQIVKEPIQSKDTKIEIEKIQLRLPQKIIKKKEQKPIIQTIKKESQNLSQSQKQQQLHQQQRGNLAKDIKKPLQNQRSSPKYLQIIKSPIKTNNFIELFRKKEELLKQNYEKKSNTYDRLLKDKILSPSTHALKTLELKQFFKLQKQSIRNKIQVVNEAVGFIKQIQQQSSITLKSVLLKPSQQKKNHSEKSNSQLSLKKSQKQQHENKYTEIKQKISYSIDILNQIKVPSISDPLQQQNQLLQQKSLLTQKLQDQNKPITLQTRLFFIKQYCISLLEFIRSSPQYKNAFVVNICTPITYDNLQLLKYYRTTIGNQNQTSYDSHQKQYIFPFFKLISQRTQILTKESFNQFNAMYNKLQEKCDYLDEREYFLASIFDAVNEALDYQRPCGIHGEPPLWVSESRALKNHYLISMDNLPQKLCLISQKFQQICGMTINRVIEWAACLCGLIPESPEIDYVIIDQEKLHGKRQDCMAAMLQKDLFQNQQIMVDFSIFQTETMLQLSQKIIQDVFGEFIFDCLLIFYK